MRELMSSPAALSFRGDQEVWNALASRLDMFMATMTLSSVTHQGTASPLPSGRGMAPWSVGGNEARMSFMSEAGGTAGSPTWFDSLGEAFSFNNKSRAGLHPDLSA